MFDKTKYNKEYRAKNLENIKLREKEYRDKNRDVLNKKARDYSTLKRKEKDEVYYRMLERKRISSKLYRKEKSDIINKYFLDNKDEINKRRRINYHANKHIKKKQILTEEQRIRKNKVNSDYAKRRRVEGRLTEFDKFKISVRRRVNYAFDRIKQNKPSNTETLIGLKLEDLKKYIESKFKDGMNWSNRNLWHIDHIIPLASAKTEEDMIKLCHYTNLQPLWAKENMSKGAKILTNNTL